MIATPRRVSGISETLWKTGVPSLSRKARHAARRDSGTLQRMRRTTFSLHLTSAVCLATLVLSGTELAAENWPQWRGPSSHGVSQEARPADDVECERERRLARAARRPRHLLAHRLGRPRVRHLADRQPRWPAVASIPSSRVTTARSPSARSRLAADVLSRSGQRRRAEPVWLVVEAFRRSDGRRLWEHRTRATGPLPEVHEKHNLATPTPATDGQRVYAWFGNGQIVALDMAGRLVWTRHLGVDTRPSRRSGDTAARRRSMAISSSCCAITCATSTCWRSTRARERSDGRWTADRAASRTARRSSSRCREATSCWSTRRSASTPTIRRPGSSCGTPGSQRQTPIPSAVFHDGRIYLSRGYRNSDYMAIRPGGRGDVTATHVEWQRAIGRARTCRRSSTTTACST